MIPLISKCPMTPACMPSTCFYVRIFRTVKNCKHNATIHDNHENKSLIHFTRSTNIDGEENNAFYWTKPYPIFNHCIKYREYLKWILFTIFIPWLHVVPEASPPFRSPAPTMSTPINWQFVQTSTDSHQIEPKMILFSLLLCSQFYFLVCQVFFFFFFFLAIEFLSTMRGFPCSVYLTLIVLFFVNELKYHVVNLYKDKSLINNQLK